MRFNVCVSQGSTLVLRTISGPERGANACAEAGRSCTGIAASEDGVKKSGQGCVYDVSDVK